MMRSAEWDFFVSYTRADRRWAEWIAWTVEAAGYQVLIQAWDIVPGTNWVSVVSDGMNRAERTIAVLSRAYLESDIAQAESLGAWHRDPAGRERRLLTVRVEKFAPHGPLAMIERIDVFDLSEEDARTALLTGVEQAISGRGKPDQPRHFPGQGRQPRFPRTASDALGAVDARTCLAIDVDDYRRSDPALREHVRARLLDMLYLALERAGVLTGACEVVDRIDGLALILPGDSTGPDLTAALVTHLCAGSAAVGRPEEREAPIRLRVGVAAGPVDLRSWTFEGAGMAAAELLASSAQVRTAMARFSRTPNAVIVADGLYQEAAGSADLPPGFSRIAVSQECFGWVMVAAGSPRGHATTPSGHGRGRAAPSSVGAASAAAGLVAGGLAAEAWQLLHGHGEDPLAAAHLDDLPFDDLPLGEPPTGPDESYSFDAPNEDSPSFADPWDDSDNPLDPICADGDAPDDVSDGFCDL